MEFNAKTIMIIAGVAYAGLVGLTINEMVKTRRINKQLKGLHAQCAETHSLVSSLYDELTKEAEEKKTK